MKSFLPYAFMVTYSQVPGDEDIDIFGRLLFILPCSHPSSKKVPVITSFATAFMERFEYFCLSNEYVLS